MRPDCPLLIVTAIAALSVATTVIPAHAQETSDPRNPSAPSTAKRPETLPRRQLDFVLMSAEAFDSDLPARVAATVDPASLQSGGYSTLFRGSADLALRGRRTEFRAIASSAARYFARLNETNIVNGDAGIGLASRVSRNSTLLVNQTAAYSPSYLYQQLLAIPAPESSLPPPSNPDYRVTELRSYSYRTTVTFSHAAIAGGEVTTTGQFDKVDFQQHALTTLEDVAIYGLQAKYSRAFSRRSTFSLGYHHRSGEFGYRGYTSENGVSIGFNYSRPLSRTRRADLSLSVMPEVVDLPASAQVVRETDRLFRLSADATFGYPLSRAWRVTANARRRLEYIAALPDPVFADGVSLAIGGPIVSRTELSFSAAYSNGASALNRDFDFDTYSLDAQVRHALTSTVQLYGGWLYYVYDFRGTPEILQNMPGRMERTGLRAGVRLLIPVMGRK